MIAMNPRVEKILKIDFPVLTLQFTNGEIKNFSCEPYLDKGFFRELQNVQYFSKAKVLDGTVAWPHEQDFCPDTLYLESHPTTDLLETYEDLRELRATKEQAAGQKPVPLHEVVAELGLQPRLADGMQ